MVFFSLKWTLSVNFLVNKKSIQILDFNSQTLLMLIRVSSDLSEICDIEEPVVKFFFEFQPEWCLEIWCPVIQTNEIFENPNSSAVDSELKACFFQLGVFLSCRNLLPIRKWTFCWSLELHGFRIRTIGTDFRILGGWIWGEKFIHQYEAHLFFWKFRLPPV